MLSDADILETAGEESLEDVKELTLRNRGLTSFEPYCGRLPQLQALSLSHNQLQNLQGFQQLHLLVTLNVNANALTSLAGLEQCSSLQQLYAASNRLRDVTPLSKLTQLQTLSLFGNAISSLDMCMQVGCCKL